MADVNPPNIPALKDNPDWIEWLKANVGKLSAADLAVVKSWNADHPEVLGAEFEHVLVGVDRTKSQEADEAIAKSVQAGKTPADDLNGDGVVSEAETRAKAETPKKASEAAVKAAEAQGATPEQAAAAGQTTGSAIEQLLEGTKPVPQILQQYITTTDGKPTHQQVQDLIKAWNTLNPLAPVTNEDELYERLAAGGNSGGPIQQQVIEVGLLGAEPLIDYKIPTIDGSSYTVSASTFELLNRQFGYSTAEMTSAVRAAAKAGLTDGRDEPAWQVLLGLANATKQRTALTPVTPPSTTAAEDAQRNLQAEVDAARYAGRAKEEGSKTPGGYTAHVVEPKNPFGTGPTQLDEALQQRNAQADAARFGGAAASQYNQTSATNLTNLAAQFQAGRALYGGDDMLGLLQVVDPSLAARVAVTDPGKLSLDDQRKVSEVFLDVGLSPDQLAALGYAWTTNYDAAGNRSGSGGGSERSMPDPAALRQAATDLYRSLYAADPTEGQLALLTGAVTSAIASAPDNQSIDPNARLRAAAEALPEHDTYYGNKPEGMSDAEYRAQFDQGAGAILGTTAAAPSTIQGGLRTGRVQTAVGAAAGQKNAFESSTFMGRLAAAAQQISEFT